MKTLFTLVGMVFGIYLTIIILEALAPIIAFITNCLWILLLVAMGIIAIGFVIGWIQGLISND